MSSIISQRQNNLDSTLENTSNIDILMPIKEAALWASDYLGKQVTTSNISYLIQYGRVSKIEEYGITKVSQQDLIEYYKSYHGVRETKWKEKLGSDLNWALSFDTLTEAETTKHVHRLHPYKGKFIPQLVEYFLDSHVDKFKQRSYFSEGDNILDPFAGSGTTLVQANELNMNAIGIDISEFNTLINNCKLMRYDYDNLDYEIKRITSVLKNIEIHDNTNKFEQKLLEELAIFNNKYFPVPDYKYKVRNKLIDGKKYGKEKEELFLATFYHLVNLYNIELLQPSNNTFLEKWFSEHVRKEIECVFCEIKKVKNIHTKKLLSVILSRTMRSCRATTHSDLATLKEPVITTYYCSKHGKICKPLFSILKWWQTYCKDTMKRLRTFDNLRTNSYQLCLAGDSRTINIFNEVSKLAPDFGCYLANNKFKGIFSSPPYVGLIDYHEQHAYAYDLFGFKRHDNLEIGSLSKGQTLSARESYINGISDVLINCKKYLVDDYEIFLVANDKYNLYPKIAEKSGMKIVEQFKRPVLNRTEKDKCAYSETIFHLKQL
jgi:DNA (cytosine-5-)-methyltransferase